MSKYQDKPEGEFTTSFGDIGIIKHDYEKQITYIDWKTHDSHNYWGHWAVSWQNEDTYRRLDNSDLESEDLLIYFGDGTFHVQSWQSGYPHSLAMHWGDEMHDERVLKEVAEAMIEVFPGHVKLENIPKKYLP